MRRHLLQLATQLRQHGARNTLARNSAAVLPSQQSVHCKSTPSTSTSTSTNTHFIPSRTFTSTGITSKEDEESTPLKGSTDSYAFEAETTQLLDIVINSLYTDKEVFLRELVSNAADALEKLRYLQTAQSDMKLVDPTKELGITISVDTESTPKTITIQDTGIGMSKEQMIENLGTIARSGSKAFLKENQQEGAVDIIGKFGVGFYAAFMVASKISVTSRSADASIDGPAHVWTSEGVGSYDITTVDNDSSISRGTKIVLELREENDHFADDIKLRTILKQYSNFVPFPIELSGNRVNTVQAIWASTPSDVSEDEYNEFYRYVANAFDEPMFKLHFRADVPLDLKALFFVPTMHSEKYGMQRMETGVSLYSRKVLIDSKPDKLLPDWLRFVKGVVDSEDLPLNISRESMQDTALIAKIGTVLTRRFLRLLEEESRKDSSKYNKFFLEFGHFLKEGVVTDFNNKNNIAKLLRFESSSRSKEDDEMSSFDDYISRCPVEQSTIYYLCAPSRALAEQSPYYEIFKRNKTEVLFLYTPIDEFVMGNLQEYDGRKLVSAETGGIDLSKDGGRSDDHTTNESKDGKEGDDNDSVSGALSDEESKEFATWLQETLSESLSDVTPSNRLVSSPAILVDHESASIMRMMKMADQEHKTGGVQTYTPLQKMEINPAHPIIKSLNQTRNEKPELAKLVAEQLHDNALVAAGIMEDPRVMLERLNTLLEEAMKGK